jgi:hypothetical protein
VKNGPVATFGSAAEPSPLRDNSGATDVARSAETSVSRAFGGRHSCSETRAAIQGRCLHRDPKAMKLFDGERDAVAAVANSDAKHNLW